MQHSLRKIARFIKIENVTPATGFSRRLFLSGLLVFCLCTLSIEGFAGDSQGRKVVEQAGQQRDILFVIDNSGSMRKNDPDLITKDIVTDFIGKHRESSFFGMVVFDKDAELAEPLTDLSALDATTRFFLGLERIDYQGRFTNTPAAVERAIYELKENGRSDADKVIILLTDGIVDTGDKDSDLEKEKWLKDDLAQESKAAGIRIFGIAFTDKADFRLIQTLASRTDGAYFRAYTVGDIPGVLDKIEERFRQVPATPAPQAPEVPRLAESAKEPGPDARPAPIAPQQEEEGEAEPDTGTMFLLPLVLAISLVILGAVVLVMTLRRGKRVEETEEREATQKDFSPPPGVEQLQGELIDVENVMQRVSPALPLNASTASIGRDSSNDIVIPIDEVSSFHATIEFKNGYYYLEDHRSTNGTYLNDGRIKENAPVRLKSGDKINFAICEFRFLLSDQAPFGETVVLQKE